VLSFLSSLSKFASKLPVSVLLSQCDQSVSIAFLSEFPKVPACKHIASSMVKTPLKSPISTAAGCTGPQSCGGNPHFSVK
jgi:hypothetical protein